MADECFDMKEIKILILNDISLMILDTWNEVESTVKTIHVAGMSEGTTAFHFVFFFFQMLLPIKGKNLCVKFSTAM
jgi:hypothetical protein